ncbi:MAG TPA: pre-toxin TG domain-containing protein, partial [Myxococcaceae bacterium]
KSPSEVALYLLARRSSLATAIELGRLAPPHLDYTAAPDKRIPPEELVLELLVGVMPVVGEATDAAGLLTGYSITGRELDANERLLCGVGALVPFVPGRALSHGGELAERAALLTGRSVEEVRVLQRVALHLSPADATQVEGLVRQAARGRKLSEEEIAFLRRLAGQLEEPLRAAATTLRRGGKVPLVGSRLGEAGLRLEPGSSEHMAAAWVDYQFRHPDKYPTFRYDFDTEWRRQYELILKNKEAGGEFEHAVLTARGQQKNTTMMMPPPGSEARGFIPDSVPGSPTPGELVWGQPYHFVEVKGRKDLALGGNLKAMLDYVEKYGGHIELWVRSPKHPGGATKLTKPLAKQLAELREDGKAALRPFP